MTHYTLQQIPNYTAYIRTLEPNNEGASAPSGPHLVAVYPPLSGTAHHADRATVIRRSNERWTERRDKIEAKLVRFLGREFLAKEG